MAESRIKRAVLAPVDAGPSPTFVPVRTRRASTEVCDQIRQLVADRRLGPGDRLPGERELAEQFGVSRGTVREALRSLEMAGIVRTRTGATGGYFIEQGHSAGIAQAVRDMVALGQVSTASITEARIELTNLAIRLACERATEADLQAIEDDITSYERSLAQGRASRTSPAVIQFYQLLARATHNEVIVMLVEALSEIVRALLARIDPKPLKEVPQMRRRVLRYLRARDVERATSAMAQHFKLLNDYLEEQSMENMARTKPARPARARAAAS
ncbi:MAG: FadR family transcriptional regulator [Burkholderiales bacterium]|nr:FadR family transcriptional regulator [Burkholderiales bacterium]OJX03433.1 MAG: hypothetical protein BGO72_04165 [Burkholderiales bacterium 70-64]